MAVAVLRNLGLGDLLAGVPALRALSEAHPEERLVLGMPRAFAPLVALIPGARIEVADAAQLPERPDLAVNLHGSGPQSHRLLLARRPRRLIAFRCDEAGHARGPLWRHEHEAERWCRLLEEHGIPARAGRLELRAPPRAPRADSGATLVHPGAAAAARRWPWKRFAAIARAEAARGRRVLVTGSERERPLAEAVARGAGLAPGSVCAGRTSVIELASLVASAGRLVCGDTGVAHLATAFGTPSVVIFGPTPPAAWGPPPERALHRVLWSGRRGDPHAPRPDPGLLRIGVRDVAEALEALDGVAPGRAGRQV